ncbi:MAG: TolC family protein [Acidobacteriota bacterium]
MHTKWIIRTWILPAAALVIFTSLASAQAVLTLDAAVANAVAQHPSMRGAQAAEREASARTDHARSALLPRVDLTETWQRGNQPVFVFGSLLAQRRFGEEDFAIRALNHPDALANYRTAVTVEQLVFDGRRTGSALDTARLGEQHAVLGTRELASSLRAAATQAYGSVLMAEAERKAALSAVQSATEDVARVERRRNAGMATEADVLALQVHLARMRAREIAAASREAVARVTLNEVMGEPIDATFVLVLPATDVADLPPIDQLEAEARKNRPDLLMAGVRVEMAEAAVTASKAGYFPQASLMGGYEWNGGTFADRSPAWNLGAYVRWNLFSGAADRARLREARAAVERAGAGRDALDARLRVELRAARARVEDARAREGVGRSASTQAAESQRITRERYEAGLASLTDLLRAADAVLDADSLHTAALVDLVISAAQLDRARGR